MEEGRVSGSLDAEIMEDCIKTVGAVVLLVELLSPNSWALS